jgi:hypothetical protein
MPDIIVYPMRRIFMLDLLIVVVTIITFVAFIGFTEGCERL